MCGENFWINNNYTHYLGTPPRVWGKPPLPVILIAVCRYTPTCVGKTYWEHSQRIGDEVHPHVCGENNAPLRSIKGVIGTPPRVWGKRRLGSIRLDVPQVHPHVCGENLTMRHVARFWIGTPPRVWGKRQSPSPQQLPARYTPTCVGKTLLYRQFAVPIAVHPHVCGENGQPDGR